MKAILDIFVIKVNEHIYIKDPLSSDLGKRIIKGSIELLDELGFDHFTFKKLGKEIDSTEASIYRYFENKYKLLLYLCAWYWRWMESRIFVATLNVPDARVRLNNCLDVLLDPITQDSGVKHVNEVKLHRIVSIESSKVYLTKDVDEENKNGVYLGYKDMVDSVADVIGELAPDYLYPHALVSTVVEGVHHQRFFQEHLPRLTEKYDGEDSVKELFVQLVYRTINIEQNK